MIIIIEVLIVDVAHCILAKLALRSHIWNMVHTSWHVLRRLLHLDSFIRLIQLDVIYLYFVDLLLVDHYVLILEQSGRFQLFAVGSRLLALDGLLGLLIWGVTQRWFACLTDTLEPGTDQISTHQKSVPLLMFQFLLHEVGGLTLFLSFVFLHRGHSTLFFGDFKLFHCQELRIFLGHSLIDFEAALDLVIMDGRAKLVRI